MVRKKTHTLHWEKGETRMLLSQFRKTERKISDDFPFIKVMLSHFAPQGQYSSKRSSRKNITPEKT